MSVPRIGQVLPHRSPLRAMAGHEPSPVGDVEKPLSDTCGASDVADGASSSGSASRHNPAHLLSLWEGHKTTADLQAVIDTQRREAAMFRQQEKAKQREIKKAKKSQTKLRAKTAKLSTQDLLRELEFRADHKAAVARAAASAATEGSTTSGAAKKGHWDMPRRGLV